MDLGYTYTHVQGSKKVSSDVLTSFRSIGVVHWLLGDKILSPSTRMNDETGGLTLWSQSTSRLSGTSTGVWRDYRVSRFFYRIVMGVKGSQIGRVTLRGNGPGWGRIRTRRSTKTLNWLFGVCTQNFIQSTCTGVIYTE